MVFSSILKYSERKEPLFLRAHLPCLKGGVRSVCGALPDLIGSHKAHSVHGPPGLFTLPTLLCPALCCGT